MTGDSFIYLLFRGQDTDTSEASGDYLISRNLRGPSRHQVSDIVVNYEVQKTCISSFKHSYSILCKPLELIIQFNIFFKEQETNSSILQFRKICLYYIVCSWINAMMAGRKFFLSYAKILI